MNAKVAAGGEVLAAQRNSARAMDRGDHEDRRPGSSLEGSSANHAAGLVLLLVVAGAVGAVVGIAAFHITSVDPALLAVGTAGMVGAAAALLAVQRFEWFLLGVFAIRSALDAFAGAAVGGLDPSIALGAMFTVLGVTWLLVQWRSGYWTPPSSVTHALYFLALAGFVSAINSAHRFVAARSAVEVLAGAVMFAVLEQLLARRPRLVRPLVVAVCVSLLLPVTVAYLQALGGGTQVDSTGLSRVMGTFAHPNPFATYLVLAIVMGVGMALVGGRVRWAGLVVLVLVAPLLLLTYTRVAWGAALIGVAYLGYRHSRRILVGLAVGLVAVMLAVPSAVSRVSDLTSEAKYEDVPANSLAWRFGYWGELVPLARESPITGIGLDTVQETTLEGLRPHNVWIQTYVETGVIGLIGLGWLVVGMCRLLTDRRRRARGAGTEIVASVAVAAALTLLAQSLTENLMTSTIIWWYAAAVMTYGLPREASDADLRLGQRRSASMRSGSAADLQAALTLR